MGNITSNAVLKDVIYADVDSVTHMDGKKTAGPIFRNPTTKLLPAESPNMTSGWDIFQSGVSNGPHKHCLGYRLPSWSVDEKGFAVRSTSGPYVWLTYRDVAGQAVALGSGMAKLGIPSRVSFPEETYKAAQDFQPLGIFMKNCVEWVVAEQSANAFNLTLVPLYDTLGVEAVSFILQDTQMSTIILGDDELDTLLECVGRLRKQSGNCSVTDLIVVVDRTKPNPRWKYYSDKTVGELGIKIRLFLDVVGLGRKKLKTPTPSKSLADVATICYTSGTTGNPKGVILTTGNFVSEFVSIKFGVFSRPSMKVDETDLHISYLPLAHILERIVVTFLLGQGGRVGFYSGDILKLMDDIQELKPTVFVSVPRMFNRIHDKVMNGLKEKGSVAQTLFSYGLESKFDKFKRENVLESRIWDPIVFGKVRAALGGNVKFMLSGAAPLDPKIAEKMQIFFSVPLLEGYGMTETMGGSFLGVPEDPLKGHVGGCIPCIEFKLESVHEMGYDATASPPAGELLLRGPSITPGYFRNPTETAALIDTDGWLHTGDIVTLLPESGRAVKIIDRRKNIFKLSQGEYVAPEKIENIYIQCPLIAQAFVVGLSTKSSLVGIFVLDVEQTKKWAQRNKISFSDEIVQDTKLRDAVMAELSQMGQSLKGFERVKKFVLTCEAFTVENDLLTPTFKLKRKDAMNKYREVLDEMYSTLD